MRYLFLIPAAILFASTANANNSLDSIFFIPKSKEIVSESSYNYSDATYKDGVNDKQELRIQTLKERVSFGITDKLYTNLEISYIDSNQKDISSTTGQFTETVNNGVSNPELSVGYRFADNDNNGFFSDLELSYAPNITNSKTGDSSKGGNVASGRSEYEVAGSYGMLFDKVSFKVDASVRYLDDAKTELMFDHAVEKIDSSIDAEFGITGQYKFNQNLSLNASLSQLLRGSYKIDKTNKIQGGDEVNLGTRLNYSIVPDKALVSVAYNYITVEDVHNTDSTGTVVTSSDRDRDEIEISFRYKF
ncbi:hypothetical protein N9O56_02080 [Rickettsiales bacterium]|nr:hypothetical protein [Rickettsiales bacterium]